MTEASPGVTSLPPEMTRAKQGSVGLPHFFTDIRIADGSGATAPRGTVGEIELIGPNVFPGYHGFPRRPQRRSPRTGGSGRATWGTSTPTATCTSPIGSRT